MTAAYEEREPDQLPGVAPPEFAAGLFGHKAVLATLLERLAARRLPGGVLLHGPRGIGKATLAFAFAREVFAATGDEMPEHVAAQVAAGAYPNLFVLRRALKDTGKGFDTAIKADAVRQLIEQMHRTRGRAGHRIAILDAIDDCNAASANALLKILEEPPADTTFLLVSHRPGALLPTIRSRCVELAMRPLPDDDVRAVLRSAAGDTNPDQLSNAAALAAGSPRRALEALQLGSTDLLEALRSWLASPGAQPPAARLALADGLAADKDSAQMRFAREMLFDWLAAEAREAAIAGERQRLASATELWEKAGLSLADADDYNLDIRQTLVALFDAIRRHAATAVPAEPR